MTDLRGIGRLPKADTAAHSNGHQWLHGACSVQLAGWPCDTNLRPLPPSTYTEYAVQRCVAMCNEQIRVGQPRQCSDRRMRLQAASTVELRCPIACGLS